MHQGTGKVEGAQAEKGNKFRPRAITALDIAVKRLGNAEHERHHPVEQD